MLVFKYIALHYLKYFFVILGALILFSVGFDYVGVASQLPDSANLVLMYVVYKVFYSIDMLLPLTLIDQLQEGNISLKQADDNKFYCDIELKLKEYGELKLRLELYDKNQLNIHVYSNSEDFKTLVKENIGSLRSALINSEITPREIRIFNEKPTKTASPYTNSSKNIDIGFEVKV